MTVAKVSQLKAEVIVVTHPPAKVSQVKAEVILQSTSTAKAKVNQMKVEVVLKQESDEGKNWWELDA